MDIGKALTKIRKITCMTQQEIADKAAITVTHLSNLERGRAEPSKTMIKKLAKAYGIPAVAIISLATEASDIKPSKAEAFKEMETPIKRLAEMAIKGLNEIRVKNPKTVTNGKNDKRVNRPRKN